jgi:hypothetical protein
VPALTLTYAISVAFRDHSASFELIKGEGPGAKLDAA